MLLHIGYLNIGTTMKQKSLFPNAPEVFSKGKANVPYCPPGIDDFLTIINYGTCYRFTTLTDTAVCAIRDTVLTLRDGLTNPFFDTPCCQHQGAFRKLNGFLPKAPCLNTATAAAFMGLVNHNDRIRARFAQSNGRLNDQYDFNF